MPMNVMIILSFYQKERITEQVRNDAAMKTQSWYHNEFELRYCKRFPKYNAQVPL
jgi:hypothetical protein